MNPSATRYSKDPRMYDTHVELDLPGLVSPVKLRVDPINRKSTDNVMPIFWEEQAFTWQFTSPYVRQALQESKGETDFLDLGCGSGVFSLLMLKQFGSNSKVIAVDKNPRAVRTAIYNTTLNYDNEVCLKEALGISGPGGIDFRVAEFPYVNIPKESVKVIGIYPPYHIYPPLLDPFQKSLPLHARGGNFGQTEFRDQLRSTNCYLANKGILFFNQMCLGDEQGPAYLHYIHDLFGDASLTYTNVLPRIRTSDFLNGVYEGMSRKWIDEVSNVFPYLYYTVGILNKDGAYGIKEVPHDIDLRGRTWSDRVELHREITKHAL